MTHHGGEPVEVLRRLDDPTHVLWRGQLHVVREVLAHWAEIGEWWHATLARPVGVAVGRATPAVHLTLVQPPLPTWGVTEETEIRLVPSPRSAAGSGATGSGVMGSGSGTGDVPAPTPEAPAATGDPVPVGGGTATGGATGGAPGADVSGASAGPPPAPALAGRLARAVDELPGARDMWRTHEPALPYDAPRRVTRDPDIQREIWRVRATAGRRGPASEFEICLDLATREWTLTHDGAHRRRTPRGG